jgi:hypothetical protein
MGKVFVSCRRKKQKKNIADFQVLGLFIPEKLGLSKNNISVCHIPLQDQFSVTSTVSSKARKL